MPNPLSKVVGVLIFSLLLIFTAYQNYKIQDDLAYQNAYHAVTNFVDNVRTKGYITPKMYEDFQSEISIGNYDFKVSMVHQQKTYTPVYTDPQNKDSFTGEYKVDYDEYYNEQIENVLYGDVTKPEKERVYKLQQDDFFQVVVENRNKTNASILFDFLTNNRGDNQSALMIPYGGMVLNEDY